MLYLNGIQNKKISNEEIISRVVEIVESKEKELKKQLKHDLLEKVREIISRHKTLEKELSSDRIDKKKFAKISKEYSDLNEILVYAKQYIDFDKNKIELEKIASDSTNENEIINLAKSELEELIKKRENSEKKLKLFLLPKDELMQKMQLLK